MRKTYRVKIDCYYFGIEYKAGDTIALSDYEKNVFESQNTNCLGEVISSQAKVESSVVEVDPLTASAMKSKKVKKVTKDSKTTVKK